ncbi:hypothetical protein L3X38_022354 [Prunus dulcis]|uniref:Uncharacterized protein n=1 Tax=Prunus dulcis TaxID=3755 RepID=A0AAD4VVU1_PRUDU|nr:hypothetical protein L3X38_022354 [Prunus dulcis]
MKNHVLGFDSIRDLLSTDPYFAPIFRDVEAGLRFDFIISDSYMMVFYFKGISSAFQILVCVWILLVNCTMKGIWGETRHCSR